jgi:hypothetical protein
MDPTITLPRATVQQALEAWEHINKYGFVLADYEGPMEQAITALKAALAQPVQEPVAWRLPDPDPEGRFEWVLYQTADFMPGVNPMDHFDGLEPLYTHPPRREWRGLKEWEINDGLDQLPTEDVCSWSFRKGVYFAEAKLKECNA